MKKYLFIVLLVGFCSGQYLTQKCQYDNKPLTKSLVGDTRKIEYGKWYTKYRCTGIKQHEYWIPDAQPNYSQANGGAEAAGYACGFLLGTLLVEAVKNNSVKNKNDKSKDNIKKPSKKRKSYKDMTDKEKAQYTKESIVVLWVLLVIIQAII